VVDSLDLGRRPAARATGDIRHGELLAVVFRHDAESEDTMIRRCEQCHCPTSGFLRLTTRLDGVTVRACEDCALDLEQAKQCQRHGKPVLSEYSSHCEDCEPSDLDGEAFRGGEAAAWEREQMAAWQRLK
jgi:hypothetical protein